MLDTFFAVWPWLASFAWFFSDTFVVVLEFDTVMRIIMKNICVNSFQNLSVCVALKNKDMRVNK